MYSVLEQGAALIIVAGIHMYDATCGFECLSQPTLLHMLFHLSLFTFTLGRDVTTHLCDLKREIRTVY